MKINQTGFAKLPIYVAAALLLPTGVHAYEAGDWVLRAGVTNVAPDESSSNVIIGGADLGAGVNVDNSAQLGLNIAYFLTSSWSIELLAATPFSHDIELPGVKLANSKQLPPSLTANYFFNKPSSAFQPYLGAGLNYTIFFDENFTQANRDAGFNDIELDDSFGITVQTGFDYSLNNNWLINASIRWIDIDTEATFNLNGSAGSVAVDIDPYVYTLSVGYKF